MATAKPNTVKVKQDDAVFDGEGGFFTKGATVECPDEETAQSLKDKGLAE